MMIGNNERASKIGCIIMASGLSRRYGRDKLLEMLEGREVILRTAMSLREAGFASLTVTRSSAVAAVLEKENFECVLHEGEKKSDTMHTGILRLDEDVSGYLFMPGDQPLVRCETLIRMREHFERYPGRPVRLGFGEEEGSPVIFPAAYREELLVYTGDRGGMEVLRRKQIDCDVVQAGYDWELWDVDTPEKMEQVRRQWRQGNAK